MIINKSIIDSLQGAEVVALVDVVGQQRVEVESRLVPVPVVARVCVCERERESGGGARHSCDARDGLLGARVRRGPSPSYFRASHDSCPSSSQGQATVHSGTAWGGRRQRYKRGAHTHTQAYTSTRTPHHTTPDPSTHSFSSFPLTSRSCSACASAGGPPMPMYVCSCRPRLCSADFCSAERDMAAGWSTSEATIGRGCCCSSSSSSSCSACLAARCALPVGWGCGV